MAKRQEPPKRGNSLDPQAQYYAPECSARTCRCEQGSCQKRQEPKLTPPRPVVSDRVKLAIIASITSVAITFIHHDTISTALSHFFSPKAQCQRQAAPESSEASFQRT